MVLSAVCIGFSNIYKLESIMPLISPEAGLGASVDITMPSDEKSMNLGIL